MKKQLKSMVEFVLEKQKEWDYMTEGLENSIFKYKKPLISIHEHANLLSQQPNIGMFVPSVFENGVWRVLEEPKISQIQRFQKPNKSFECFLNEYQQGKANVIFKGWELLEFDDEVVRLKNKEYTLFFDIEENECHIDSIETYKQMHTLEDLVKFNLEMI